MDKSKRSTVLYCLKIDLQYVIKLSLSTLLLMSISQGKETNVFKRDPNDDPDALI